MHNLSKQSSFCIIKFISFDLESVILNSFANYHDLCLPTGL